MEFVKNVGKGGGGCGEANFIFEWMIIYQTLFLVFTTFLGLVDTIFVKHKRFCLSRNRSFLYCKLKLSLGCCKLNFLKGKALISGRNTLNIGRLSIPPFQAAVLNVQRRSRLQRDLRLPGRRLRRTWSPCGEQGRGAGPGVRDHQQVQPEIGRQQWRLILHVG